MTEANTPHDQPVQDFAIPKRFVPQEVADAYREFMSTLSEAERNIEIGSGGVSFRRGELTDHLDADDAVGRKATKFFLKLQDLILKSKALGIRQTNKLLHLRFKGFTKQRENVKK